MLESRRGDLDGRGNLSQRALVEWIGYVLSVCQDQVAFMSGLLRLGDIDNARDHLSKLAALDQRDQLGASALLDIIDPVPDVSAA